jgi:hypothetical protein
MIRLLSSALSIAVFATASLAHADTPPETVPAVFDKVYIPGGFDSNDNVQIVGEGMFANTCYKPGPTKFTIDRERKIVLLYPTAYRYDGACLFVMMPYSRQVDVGILDSGTWTVLQGANKTKIGEVNIRSSLSKNADDFVYAPVSQAFFNQTNKKTQVILTVELPCDCLAVEDVKLTLEKDVLVLQPILKPEVLTGGSTGFLPIKKVIDLPSIPAGRYLLHVRSMNGNAINTLVEAK